MDHQLAFSLKYNYSRFSQGITLPVAIEVGNRRTRVDARLDTGSQFCVFERDYGEYLGLDLETGPTIRLSTAAGSFTASGHAVMLQFEDFRFESFVYFALDRIPRSVLGQTGWLDRLRIGIVHHENLLYLASYDE